MKTFRTSRIVEFGETDMAGIVHFSNFFRYMESAECALLRSLGLGVKLDWEGQTLGFPRVAATCDYVRPARFEDVLDVEVAIVRLGEKSVAYGFDFTRAGELIAKGKVTSVCCRVLGEHKLQSIPIPASYRAHLEPYVRGAG
jgi:YbgC/YbaW family acyl-CoA thioester hydrolase